MDKIGLCGWIDLGRFPTHKEGDVNLDAVVPSIGHVFIPRLTVTPGWAAFCIAAMAEHTRAYRQMLGEWAFRLHQRIRAST